MSWLMPQICHKLMALLQASWHLCESCRVWGCLLQQDQRLLETPSSELREPFQRLEAGRLGDVAHSLLVRHHPLLLLLFLLLLLLLLFVVAVVVAAAGGGGALVRVGFVAVVAAAAVVVVVCRCCCCWLLLVVVGCCWLLLVVVGCCCCCWWLLLLLWLLVVGCWLLLLLVVGCWLLVVDCCLLLVGCWLMVVVVVAVVVFWCIAASFLTNWRNYLSLLHPGDVSPTCSDCGNQDEIPGSKFAGMQASCSASLFTAKIESHLFFLAREMNSSVLQHAPTISPTSTSLLTYSFRVGTTSCCSLSSAGFLPFLTSDPNNIERV